MSLELISELAQDAAILCLIVALVLLLKITRRLQKALLGVAEALRLTNAAARLTNSAVRKAKSKDV